MDPTMDPTMDDAQSSSDAELDAQLRALPTRNVDPRVDQHVLRSARATLARAEVGTGAISLRAVVHALHQIWARAVAPALVTATVASYLVWAVRAAGSLYR